MMTIEQFGRRLRARELTATRVTEECLRRIEADNPRLNAFITVMGDEALRQAREAHVAAADAPTIARLRMAGTVFIGKTNLHEFAFGTTSDDSAFGPARNP